jgi:hypothetical protein
MTDVVRSLTYETAKTYIGQKFQIRFDDGATIDLNLEHVELLMEKHINPRMKRDAFSMQFRGPMEPLQQAIYPIHHDELGPLSIFLVPLSRGANGYLYEAVFN